MSQLIKGKNIIPSKISFSEPRVLDNGAKLVYVNYDGGRFTVQTPWMEMPWKMGCYDQGEYPKYSAEFSFKGMDNNEDLAAFHDRLNEVDSALIDGGVANSVAWFKKKKASRDVIEALFNPIVRVSKDKESGEPDGKWPSTFKAKVPQRNNIWECKLYDKEGKQFQINDRESSDNVEDILVKGAKIRAIIQCVGLWIASGNYMCQWKLVKAEVDVPISNSTQDFLPDSDDEDNNSPEPEMLDSTEDEDEDEVVEEEVKVVKKKKSKK